MNLRQMKILNFSLYSPKLGTTSFVNFPSVEHLQFHPIPKSQVGEPPRSSTFRPLNIFSSILFQKLVFPQLRLYELIRGIYLRNQRIPFSSKNKALIYISFPIPFPSSGCIECVLRVVIFSSCVGINKLPESALKLDGLFVISHNGTRLVSESHFRLNECGIFSSDIQYSQDSFPNDIHYP
ncbi:hypothetical protein Avbf_06541 [Armadillidium vulgare]|nr:hypothetical protein Avbf_06541 [Armadillidium vulgare]